MPAASRTVKVTTAELPEAIETGATVIAELARLKAPGVTVMNGAADVRFCPLMAATMARTPARTPVKVAV